MINVSSDAVSTKGFRIPPQRLGSAFFIPAWVFVMSILFFYPESVFPTGSDIFGRVRNAS